MSQSIYRVDASVTDRAGRVTFEGETFARVNASDSHKARAAVQDQVNRLLRQEGRIKDPYGGVTQSISLVGGDDLAAAVNMVLVDKWALEELLNLDVPRPLVAAARDWIKENPNARAFEQPELEDGNWSE